VTGILELPPAGTLTGIARRALKGVETFALKTPDQLDDARAFAEKHGSPSEIDASPTWRLLVAPMKGTFSRSEQVNRESGDTVEAGEVVAKVKSLRDELEVKAPHGGIVVEWLVEEGDPVSPGQPLVRLHPNGANA
jgi:[acyl-carrier-protein] S-malonyltransferase